MREVEGLSVDETADALGVNPATVKTRLLRARRRLQDALAPELRSALSESFTFAGLDCEAMTETVVRAWCGEPSVE
jgi:RNA polymerase sigma-70 factor (ECF subfamily)